jgi:hypothetical protein
LNQMGLNKFCVYPVIGLSCPLYKTKKCHFWHRISVSPDTKEKITKILGGGEDKKVSYIGCVNPCGFDEKTNNIIILDSGSSIHLTGDLNLINGLNKIEAQVITGVGNITITSNFKGTLKYDLGETLFVENSRLTILSLNLVKNNFFVKYNDVENSFELTHKTKNLILVFKFCYKNNLFVLNEINNSTDLSSLLYCNSAVLMNKAEKQNFIYSRIETLHNVLNHPGLNSFIQTLESGILGDVQLDKNMVKNWYEQNSCIGCGAGKSTKINSRTTLNKADKAGLYVEIDIFFIQKQLYLIGIDLFSSFVITYDLNTKNKNDILEGIKAINAKFKSLNVKVENLISDKESAITHLEIEINNLGINLIQMAPQDHCHTIERCIRSIKYKVYSTIHCLLNSIYVDLPLFFLKY